MMFILDAINRCFGNLISRRIAIAALLRSCNRANRDHAYTTAEFSNLVNVNITETDNPSSNPPLLFTNDVLHLFYQDITTH